MIKITKYVGERKIDLQFDTIEEYIAYEEYNDAKKALDEVNAVIKSATDTAISDATITSKIASGSDRLTGGTIYTGKTHTTGDVNPNARGDIVVPFKVTLESGVKMLSYEVNVSALEGELFSVIVEATVNGYLNTHSDDDYILDCEIFGLIRRCVVTEFDSLRNVITMQVIK